MVKVPIGLFVLIVLWCLWRPETRRPQRVSVLGAQTLAGAVFCLLSALTAPGNNRRLVTFDLERPACCIWPGSGAELGG